MTEQHSHFHYLQPWSVVERSPAAVVCPLAALRLLCSALRCYKHHQTMGGGSCPEKPAIRHGDW
ncbi:MAG: hypothetical protein V2I51_08540, partial [Anderseniella sp.]|nr:hypothetical protein [Anderseniella sp.]